MHKTIYIKQIINLRYVHSRISVTDHPVGRDNNNNNLNDSLEAENINNNNINNNNINTRNINDRYEDGNDFFRRYLFEVTFKV